MRVSDKVAFPEKATPIGDVRGRARTLSPLIPLAGVMMLQAGDLSSLGQAVEGIKSSFGVSDKVVGLLPTAMLIVGTLGGVPFGYLADRARRTWLMAMAVTVWITIMGLNAIAPTFAFLFIARLGIGIVEANGSAALSLLSDYYPVRDRARVLGLWNSGSLVGSMIGLAVGGLLIDLFGWRAAFWMWIPLGIGVLMLLLRLPEPARGTADAQAEDEAEAASAAHETSPYVLPAPTRVGTVDYRNASWRECFQELLQIRSTWFALIGITISNAFLYGLGFWSIEYFKRTYGVGGFAAGAAAAAFGLGAAVGVVGGGVVADRYMRRGMVNARIYIIAVASVLTTVFFFAGFFVTVLWLSIPFFLLGAVCLLAMIGPTEAIFADVIVAPMRGRVAAIRGFVRSLSTLSVPAIGALSDIWDLRVAFLVFAPLCAIGGVIVLVAARSYPYDLSFVLHESKRLRAQEAAATP